MYIKTVFDTENPETHYSIETLLLGLDGDIEFFLPNEQKTIGILREVTPLGNGRLVEMIIEIDDRYESLYFINHSRGDIDLVQRRN